MSCFFFKATNKSQKKNGRQKVVVEIEKILFFWGFFFGFSARPFTSRRPFDFFFFGIRRKKTKKKRRRRERRKREKEEEEEEKQMKNAAESRYTKTRTNAVPKKRKRGAMVERPVKPGKTR